MREILDHGVDGRVLLQVETGRGSRTAVTRCAVCRQEGVDGLPEGPFDVCIAGGAEHATPDHQQPDRASRREFLLHIVHPNSRRAHYFLNTDRPGAAGLKWKY